MTRQLSLDLSGTPTARRSRSRPPILFFASGTNDCGEIRGFADLGIHIGFSAAAIGQGGLDELERHAGTGLQVFGDTGAYSECSSRRTSAREEPCVPSADAEGIQPEDWQSRLALLDRVAAMYGSSFTVVAPDRVGDQEATLDRLTGYRREIRALARRGARILVPLHAGTRSLAAFHRETGALLGIPTIPAFPVPRGRTPAMEVLHCTVETAPRSIHLLGAGLRSRWARELVPLLSRRHPALHVSMDANLITSAVGRRVDGTPQRPLTAAQDTIRHRGFPRAFGETVDAEWAIHADYTDAVALPSTWLGPAPRRAIARALSLSSDESRRWRSDPDGFLQRPIDGPGSPSWWEHPAMEAALDAAWLNHLHRLHTAPRKAEAIRATFASHPAAGQFVPRRPTRLAA